MWLASLEADRLRALRAVGLRLGSGLTLVIGRNGHGKTSLLEAVYLLATGRSFRTQRIDEVVAWEGGPARVGGEILSRRGRARLGVVIEPGARHLLVEGAERQLEDYLGQLDLVDLTAERMQAVRGAPAERRRLLDRGIVGLWPAYLRVLGEYRRALRQRNALLRTGAGRAARRGELEAWDERLARAGAAVHLERRRYAVRLAARLGEAQAVVFPEGGELALHYRPSPAEARAAEPAELAATLLRRLEQGRPRDLALGLTTSGPHRDDLAVELGGVDLRRFGSAGQVRASMIGLKLAKLSLLREERGEAPLFLMDDFDTDLDEVRAASVARYLRDGGFQALVATSKAALADRLGVDSVRIHMDAGQVREG